MDIKFIVYSLSVTTKKRKYVKMEKAYFLIKYNFKKLQKYTKEGNAYLPYKVKLKRIKYTKIGDVYLPINYF